MISPTQLSQELREDSNPDLRRRRWIIGISFASVIVGKMVALYQSGIIKNLPDPPLEIFDSNKVDASDYAYKRLNLPDAFLMVINSGITAALAAAGGKDRATDAPYLSIAMGVKTLTDLAATIKLGFEEWKENEKLCFYCQIATGLSLVNVTLSIPEVIVAIKTLGTKKLMSPPENASPTYMPAWIEQSV